jgi:hypothetical protein
VSSVFAIFDEAAVPKVFGFTVRAMTAIGGRKRDHRAIAEKSQSLPLATAWQGASYFGCRTRFCGSAVSQGHHCTNVHGDGIQGEDIAACSYKGHPHLERL